MKRPVVGDRVWYWPGAYGHSRGASGGTQPLAGIISHVTRNTVVNVCYFDARGVAWAASDIPLWNGESAKPDSKRPWCEWPHEELPTGDKHSGD